MTRNLGIEYQEYPILFLSMMMVIVMVMMMMLIMLILISKLNYKNQINLR